MSKWTFLTNHALVLIHVGQNPRSTLREIAQAVGITERAALSILRALEEDSLISRQKEGRRNRYWLNYSAILRDHREAGLSALELANILADIDKRV